MAEKRTNPRKEKHLQSFPQSVNVSDISDVKGKISFSFKYFDSSQEAGQDFKDWTNEEKNQLLGKLKAYSCEDKRYWLSQGILAIYDTFPRNSDFTCPVHVPQEVKWSRFRLESAVRLVGFFADEDAAKSKGISSEVFYVVFLDKNHRFYKMEKK